MRSLSAFALTLAAALLSGCATPTIDHKGYARPTTVAIVDFPDVKPAATIGILNAKWPDMFFAGPADPYFVSAGGQYRAAPVARQAAMAAVTGGLVGLALGSAIDAGAQATQDKAEGYPDLVAAAMPGVDIRTDVLAALRASLEAKGIAVAMLDDSRELAPRLRWPANLPNGNPAALTGPLADSMPVEADIVAQVVPMVVYASPGALNNYNSVVGIGLALYDGRTRKFLGWQAFESNQNKLWYARYDSLVADIAQAAPAQHAALMSLIPQVSDAISGGQ